MASDLKWRTGFDWGSVLLLALAALAGIFASGALRWIAVAVGLLVALFMIAQYRKWNAAGWPSLHWRGMLLYSSLAGLESGQASTEGREFDREAVCRELALKMCGPGKEENVDAMLVALREEGGSYLASLLRDHGRQRKPAPEEAARFEELLKAMADAELGPQLVICNVIENTYGRSEAARYALALVEGRAS